MVRQLAFGLLWFVIFYLFGCFLAGTVAGTIAGSHDGANALGTGAKAGFDAVLAWQGYCIVIAALVSAVCTWKHALPGTAPVRSKLPTDEDSHSKKPVRIRGRAVGNG